jgi:hypothetical protein
MRDASQYGWRSRGRWFPSIKLQEIKSSTSRPFTLWAKSKGRSYLKWLLFEKNNGLLKEVWVGRDWKPTLWSRGCQFFFIQQSIIDKILGVRLEGLLWAGYNVGYMLLWVWSMGFAFGRPSWEAVGVNGQRFGLWAFGGFTLCPTKCSTYYILLATFSPFLGTFNKVWPLNPIASRLRWL